MERPPQDSQGSKPPGGESLPAFEAEFPGEPRPPTRHGGGSGRPNPWLIGLAVAVLLVAVSIAAFGFLSPDDEAAGPTSTTASSTTVPGETTTTGPDDGSTTTSNGGEVTTLPDDTIPEIVPEGEAIPIAELELSTNDIGPLDFGADGDEVLGRLAATFGEPTQDTGFIVGDGSWGECPGDPIRVVQWAPLSVVLAGAYGNSDFVSYRIDLRYGGITSPPTDMETISGLSVGQTVGEMKSIYSGLAIEFVVDEDAGLVFELREQLGGPLLLWGPVESTEDDAMVTGIYSPDSCEA